MAATSSSSMTVSRVSASMLGTHSPATEEEVCDP